jgi:hypothetical protein
MAMDDTEATDVGEGRWKTYGEPAVARQIGRRAAIRLAQHHRLRRQPGNDGKVRIRQKTRRARGRLSGVLAAWRGRCTVVGLIKKPGRAIVGATTAERLPDVLISRGQTLRCIGEGKCGMRRNSNLTTRRAATLALFLAISMAAVAQTPPPPTPVDRLALRGAIACTWMLSDSPQQYEAFENVRKGLTMIGNARRAGQPFPQAEVNELGKEVDGLLLTGFEKSMLESCILREGAGVLGVLRSP